MTGSHPGAESVVFTQQIDRASGNAAPSANDKAAEAIGFFGVGGASSGNAVGDIGGHGGQFDQSATGVSVELIDVNVAIESKLRTGIDVIG